MIVLRVVGAASAAQAQSDEFLPQSGRSCTALRSRVTTSLTERASQSPPQSRAARSDLVGVREDRLLGSISDGAAASGLVRRRELG
jgi:hypothetical protein